MQWRKSAKTLSGAYAKSSSPEHSPAPTPSRAVYGFVLYLLSNFCLVLYFVWALVPDSLLFKIGIDFFPQKYWAVTIPLFLSFFFLVFVFIIYPSLGRLHCTGMDNSGQMTDKHAISRQAMEKELIDGGVPPVYDMSLEDIRQHFNLS